MKDESEWEIKWDVLFYLTFVTEHSSSVPPSWWWRITCTDHLLCAEFHGVPVLGWTTRVQDYSEKASDWVERRGATTVYHSTSSRQTGNSVVESNTWEEATQQPAVASKVVLHDFDSSTRKIISNGNTRQFWCLSVWLGDLLHKCNISDSSWNKLFMD